MLRGAAKGSQVDFGLTLVWIPIPALSLTSSGDLGQNYLTPPSLGFPICKMGVVSPTF